MTNKTYTIQTVQDIFNIITLDNLDSFMADMYHVLYYAAIVKDGLTEEQLKDIKMPSFDWIDDGKHDLDIHLNSTGDE